MTMIRAHVGKTKESPVRVEGDEVVLSFLVETGIGWADETIRFPRADFIRVVNYALASGALALRAVEEKHAT